MPAVAAQAAGVRHHRSHSVLRCVDGRRFEATLVVDATGGQARLVRYAEGSSPAYQTAYGISARFDNDPLLGEPMVLMDYRDRADERGPPSFLYGWHQGDGRWFVEETVLAARPAVPVEVLEQRLHRRLRTRGVCPLRVYERERCKIAMGTALPSLERRMLAFGASAGLVHPATGYQMGHMLQVGQFVADAICHGLRRGLPCAGVVRRAGEAMWPDWKREARRLLLFGMEVVAGLDRRGASRFFGTFFSLPRRDWCDYMSGQVDSARLTAIMWQLFQRAPMSLRIDLARRAVMSGQSVWRGLAAAADRGLRRPRRGRWAHG